MTDMCPVVWESSGRLEPRDQVEGDETRIEQDELQRDYNGKEMRCKGKVSVERKIIIVCRD